MGEHPIDKVFREALNEVPTPPPSPAGWAETLSAVKATGAIGTISPLATITGKIIVGSIVVATVATTAVVVSSDKETGEFAQRSEQVIEQDEQSSDEVSTAQYEDFLVPNESVSEELEAGYAGEKANNAVASAAQPSIQEEGPTGQGAGSNSGLEEHSLIASSGKPGDAGGETTSTNEEEGALANAPLNHNRAYTAATNDRLGSESAGASGSTATQGKAGAPGSKDVDGSATATTADNSGSEEPGTPINEAGTVEDRTNNAETGYSDRERFRGALEGTGSAAAGGHSASIGTGAGEGEAGPEARNMSIAGSGVSMPNSDAIAERMEVLSRVVNPIAAVQVMPYDSSLAKNLPPSPLQRFTILPYLSIDHSILDLGVAARYGGQNSTVLNLDANRQMRYTLGVRLIYNLNDRISIQSGMYYVNKGRLSGSLGDMDGQMFTEFDLSAEYLEIPLLVSYRIPFEGFGIRLTTGAHLQKNLSSGSDLIREGNINTGIVSTVGLNAASSGASIIAAVGLDFRVSRNVYVLLEPSYRHSLNPVIQLENTFGYTMPVDPLIHSFGLGTGLLIKLK